MNKVELIQQAEFQMLHWPIYFGKKTVGEMIKLHQLAEVVKDAPEHVFVGR